MPEFRHRPLWLSEWTLATQRNPTTSSVNLSCASGLLLESILRSNDYQNGFHTAKTHCGSSYLPANARCWLPLECFVSKSKKTRNDRVHRDDEPKHNAILSTQALYFISGGSEFL